MAARCWMGSSLGVALLTLVGCGGPSMESVEGKVTLDGAPLAGAHVSLTSKDASVKFPFVGKTDDQGHFSLGTVESPGGGAPVGSYTLAITTKVTEAADEFAKPPVERVPAPYATGVDFEVPDGGKTDADFALTSAKK